MPDKTTSAARRAEISKAIEEMFASVPYPANMPDGTAIAARRAEVRKAIEEAFADVPYPGDDAIGDDPAYDDSAKLNRDFKGHHWRRVPQRKLTDHESDLGLFSPKGRQFYLPAYLLGALDDACLLNCVVYRLADLDNERRIQCQYGFYTSAQKGAVRLFLEFVRDEAPVDQGRRGDCDLALSKYWGCAQEAPQAEVPLDRAQVKQAILEAFATVAYPGDTNIASEESMASSGRLLARDFRGLRAEEVPRGVLVRHRMHLPSFSDAGLHYYLPAYLLATLESGRDLAYHVVLELEPWQISLEDVARFKRRFERYSEAQRSAVCLFLRYARDAVYQEELWFNAQNALDCYWAEVGS